MNDLMDAWTIVGKKWDLPYDFHVRLTRDGQIDPTKEYDCYDEADISAWERDDWCFVTIELVPVDKFGVVYESASDVLGACEWGQMPEVTICRVQLEESHIKDMASCAAEAADRIRKKIAHAVHSPE